MKRVPCIAAVIAVLLTSACSTPHADGNGAQLVATATVAATVAATTPTPSETTEAVGTRTNPVPVGTTFQVGDNWEVTLAATNPDATAAVMAENQFNEIADGRAAVMVPITVKYIGTESGTPWLDLSFSFLGASGNSFATGSDDSCGVIPGDLMDVNEMFPGAASSANECVAVPVSDIPGGAWIVEESFSFDETRVFVATV
jgi:hypothetical protein